HETITVLPRGGVVKVNPRNCPPPRCRRGAARHNDPVPVPEVPMRRWLSLLILCGAFPLFTLLEHVEVVAVGPDEAADLIVHHARVVRLKGKTRITEAGAVRGGRVVAVGDDEAVLRHKGPKTRLIDAGGRTVLPGLYDSHVPPVGAATSELPEPIPN